MQYEPQKPNAGKRRPDITTKGNIPSGAPTDIEPCIILVVDDSTDDCVLMKRELEKSDYVHSVHTFQDGEYLLAYMREHGFMDHSVMVYRPMIILVDIEMPLVDGLEVIRRLKSDQFLKDIPVVAVSATESPDKLDIARKNGANGVFKKPLERWMFEHYIPQAWKWPPEDLWR